MTVTIRCIQETYQFMYICINCGDEFPRKRAIREGTKPMCKKCTNSANHKRAKLRKILEGKSQTDDQDTGSIMPTGFAISGCPEWK